MAALSCARAAPRFLMKPTCSPKRRLPCTGLSVASDCRSRAFGRVHKRPSCSGNTFDAAARRLLCADPGVLHHARAHFTVSAAMKRPQFVRLIDSGSAPSLSKRFFVSGEAKTGTELAHAPEIIDHRSQGENMIGVIGPLRVGLIILWLGLLLPGTV